VAWWLRRKTDRFEPFVSSRIVGECVLNSFKPPPHNQIYSRFWYAFSLFLRKFHSVNPFNGNFCELGRARFAEKKMEFPSQVVSKTYSILFRPNSDLFRTHSGAVHDERAEWTCSCHGLCNKTWDPPHMEVKTLWVLTWKKHIVSEINLIVWRGLCLTPVAG